MLSIFTNMLAIFTCRKICSLFCFDPAAAFRLDQDLSIYDSQFCNSFGIGFGVYGSIFCEIEPIYLLILQRE